MTSAPRLPHQLAALRVQLRELSSDCDRLQALQVEEEVGKTGLVKTPKVLVVDSVFFVDF